MCTASWSAGRGRLALCFNRDERKSRGEALEPRVIEVQGTKVLAAIDSDSGGTWLAVNEFGLCVFLLNNYGVEALLAKTPLHLRSRGELPLTYASFSSRSAAVEALLQGRFSSYSPFLIVLADGDGVDLFSWDGAAFEAFKNVANFLTTSSFRTLDVQTYRQSRYELLLAGRTDLSEEERRELHVGTPHPDSAFNPMMLRSESRTHSVSTLSVDSTGVRYVYEAVAGESRQLGEAKETALPGGFQLGSD